MVIFWIEGKIQSALDDNTRQVGDDSYQTRQLEEGSA